MKLETYTGASPKAALVLAHGAGAGQKSPFMVRFARGMAERHINTATFDFPYISAGRKVPDRAPVLEQAWRDAVDAGKAEFARLPLYIGGKSMGGRMASHIAAQGCAGIKGLVFLGYPLHPPGQPEKRRDAHLPAIGEPMLFVQGTRDAFGTQPRSRRCCRRLQHAELHEVAGGDHSFKVSGRKGDGLDSIMDVVAAWVVAGPVAVTSPAPCARVAPPPPRQSETSSATPPSSPDGRGRRSAAGAFATRARPDPRSRSSGCWHRSCAATSSFNFNWIASESLFCDR